MAGLTALINLAPAATLRLLSPGTTEVRTIGFAKKPSLHIDGDGLIQVSDGDKSVVVNGNYFVSLESGATPNP